MKNKKTDFILRQKKNWYIFLFSTFFSLLFLFLSVSISFSLSIYLSLTICVYVYLHLCLSLYLSILHFKINENVPTSWCKNYFCFSYFGYTTITLFRRFTYDLSENNAIKQHLIIKHNNSSNQLTSSDVWKILTDNTIIIYKNNNKKRLQILEAICIKNK